MRRIRLLLAVGAIVTVTVVGILAIKGWRQAIAAGGAALIAGVVGAEFLRSIRGALGERVTAFDRLLVHVPSRPGRPGDLSALERTLGWGTYSPDEFGHRVRPTLFRLARLRILEHLGVDIAHEREAAPELIRRYLLDEDLTEPVTTREIAEVIDELEGI